jgi:hypothetical protein
MDFKEYYKQFGHQNPNYYFRRVARDKSGEGRYLDDARALERIFADPTKYSQQEIRDAYGKVFLRPGSRESRELNDERYYDNLGGGEDGDDFVLNKERLATAQNRYDIGLQDLLFRASPTAPAPSTAPAPTTPTPALPTISDEAKQYRAETMKIMQQADERMKAYETQRAQDEAARVEREKIAAQTAAARSANMMRAGQAPNMQIQPARQTPRTGGTQPFKRRSMQIGGVSPYLGLAISS